MSSTENQLSSSDRTSAWRKVGISVLILFASVAAAAFLCAVFGYFYAKFSPAVPGSLHTIEVPATGGKMNPETIIQSQPVRDADAQLQRAVEDTINEIHLFFESARTNSPVFADQVLGIGSKARLVADKLPFTRDDRFQHYLQRFFNDTIFSEETLAQAVELAVVRFETQIQGIEKEMLVNLTETFPEVFSEASDSQYTGGQKLSERYFEALNQVVAENRSHVSAGVKADLAGEIAGSLLGFVMRKLAVSGGMLAAGAGGSAYTFGVSLVAAIIGDMVISWVWDWYADPAGEIARSVNTQLDEVEALLVEGDEEQPGFRKTMTTRVEYYTQYRNQAFAQMVR